MANFNLYRPDTNWYMRIVRPSDGFVYDTDAAAMAAAPTWANSVVSLTFSAAINGYPITIPAGVPDGNYELQFYDAAVPAEGDEVLYGEVYKYRNVAIA